MLKTFLDISELYFATIHLFFPGLPFWQFYTHAVTFLIQRRLIYAAYYQPETYLDFCTFFVLYLG